MATRPLGRVPSYFELVSSLYDDIRAKRVTFEGVEGAFRYDVRVDAIKRITTPHTRDTRWQVDGEAQKGLSVHCEWSYRGKYGIAIQDATITTRGED